MITLLVVIFSAHADQSIRLFPGYVTKVFCQGKLLVSSLGNDSLVRLEPYPKEIGCAVILKPLSVSGRTNLVLETSSSSIQSTLEIKTGTPNSKDLQVYLKEEKL